MDFYPIFKVEYLSKYPPKSPLKRGTLIIPPFLRGARGDLDFKRGTLIKFSPLFKGGRGD